jgi:glycosyltransferase 2 family protein
LPVLRRLASALTSLPGRLIISASLLALVAKSIDWGTLDRSLSGAGWGWFALGVVLIAFALMVGAVRWHVLLHGAALPTTGRETLRAYMIGTFSNNFLPTGYGGDAVRAWLVGRSGKPMARAFTSVFVDRGVALVALFFLGWLGLAITPVDVPRQLATPFWITTALGTLFLVVTIMMLRRRGLGRFLPNLIRPSATEVAQTLRIYGRDHRLQVETLVLSLGYQVISIGSLWCLAEALQLDISPATLAVVSPLVLIATLMPISVAGFGVREGTYVLLLGEVGVSAGDATLLSVFSVIALAIASLPGGIAIALGWGQGFREMPADIETPVPVDPAGTR